MSRLKVESIVISFGKQHITIYGFLNINNKKIGD